MFTPYPPSPLFQRCGPGSTDMVRGPGPNYLNEIDFLCHLAIRKKNEISKILSANQEQYAGYLKLIQDRNSVAEESED